jgi:hypothetical protein
MSKLESIEAIVQKAGEYFNADACSLVDLKLFVGEHLQAAYDKGHTIGEWSKCTNPIKSLV